jgi:predicted transcriptional regulator
MRSKLEMYIDILKVLEQKGPLRITPLINKANVNGNLLKECLDLLIKHGLIVTQAVGKSSLAYATTDRGTAVIKFFTGANKTYHVEREDGIVPVSN